MQSYYRIISRECPLLEEDSPQDLVEPDVLFAPGTAGEKRLLRMEAARHLEQLFDCAARQGIYLAAVSGYRSYGRQREIYEASLAAKGEAYTLNYIAPPGASEHQTGLAMDVSCEALGYELEEGFAGTKEGIWLKKNAGLFGFIIRYPEGKEEITGYQYEPWHIRYVSRALSCYLSRFELSLEEGISSLERRF